MGGLVRSQLPSSNKMPLSKETMIVLFFNCPTSFHVLHLFFNSLSILLAKFIHYFCLKTNFKSTDDDDGCEQVEQVYIEPPWFFFDVLTEEEDLATDISYDREVPSLLPMQTTQSDQVPLHDSCMEEPAVEEPKEVFVAERLVLYGRQVSRSGHIEDYVSEEESTEEEEDSTDMRTAEEPEEEEVSSSIVTDQHQDGPILKNVTLEEECDGEEAGRQTIQTNISEDGKFFILEPKQLQYKESVKEDHFQDLFTDESISKSSSEWRSSLNYRDSGIEDPFSSSSRRSCPTWESCTLFRKYDEEMMFFDRFSAQKLTETESFRAIEVRPKSVSQRIVHKITRTQPSEFRRNPDHELETAYVAQICLTWEALNWNYKNFKRLRASQTEEDPGCPGQIAQQFQQFQVLLQRFIENEPFEHGRRPEVYARMRNSAPRLLQVPEFIGSEDSDKNNGLNTMISSIKFLRIMEDAIRTFMNFLKADRERPCEIFKAFFKKKHRRSSVDPFLLNLMKKTIKKKQRSLKDVYRSKKCFRKPKMKDEDEMEILMCLIDLKMVSRVLRMHEISEQQLHWCEEKMNKVKVWEGKVKRDSSPLFFPNTLTHHHSMLLLDD